MAGRFEEGFRRIQAALDGVPDRVPFTAQAHEFAMTWTDTPSGRFYTDPGAYLRGMLKTAEEFDLDVPGLAYDVYNIEAEAMGQPVLFRQRQSPVLDPAAALARDARDLSRLRPPVPGKSARMPFVLEVRRLYREALGVTPPIQFCAPFSLAVLLRGYEELVQDIYTRPDAADDLLRFATEEVIAPWIDAQKRASPGAARAVGADALCSPPMVNPDIIERFSVPWIHRLRELCGVPVAVVNWWGESCCRPAEALLELKRIVACGLIRVQDPDVSRMGVEVFKRYAEAHCLALEVGIGDEVIDRGPAAAIEERVRAYIAGAARGGRLVLYLCNVNASTPAQHLRAAVSAIKAQGVYPRAAGAAGGGGRPAPPPG